MRWGRIFDLFFNKYTKKLYQISVPLSILFGNFATGAGKTTGGSEKNDLTPLWCKVVFVMS